jgi:hypothetical protein
MATGFGTGIEAEGDTMAKKKSKPKSPFLGRWHHDYSDVEIGASS